MAAGFGAGFACAQDKPNIIVFYADDQGFADLSAQGVVADVRTPHIDSLAAGGVRALNGYSTAPQCVPSRAGLLSGRSQNRFGVEANGDSGEILATQTPFPKRLQAAGYVTAQFGKWHLGAASRIVGNGFTYQFPQNAEGAFPANLDVHGQERPLSEYNSGLYHLDACSQAAAALIRRRKDKPLFLYIAYRAPHVPLDPPQKYLDRFPGPMPERRRKALAMLSAMDDGVGLVMKTLKEEGLLEKTLIFYTADNGAPLKITMPDDPGGGPGWDGSRNDPMNGEKGTLMEGGMHEPFVVAWKGVIPPGRTYPHPIWTLDIGATAVAVGGASAPPGSLDGINLIPYLSGKNTSAPHQALHWRWVAQSAVRKGDWKFLKAGEREYLFNLAIDIGERFDLTSAYPAIAKALKDDLTVWVKELDPPGFSLQMAPAWNEYYDHYLDATVPDATPIAAECKDGSFTLPKGGKVSEAGIYLDTLTTGGVRQIRAYVLPADCGRPVSINGPGADREFRILLDPASGQASITSLNPTSLLIYRADGSVRYRQDRPANRHLVDVRNWNKGVYLVSGNADGSGFVKYLMLTP